MPKARLDQVLTSRGLVPTRSQAESFIRLGQVQVNGQVVTKTGQLVRDTDTIRLMATEQYVSRAGLKLASVAELFGLAFKGKTVLDVGSSTGGFTDYALRNGAARVLAVDVGTQQLHPSLRDNPRVELHEKTDIRDFRTTTPIDIVVIDVSFISLRDILPSVTRLTQSNTLVVAMVKPQFEAGQSDFKHEGVIKNERVRRMVLKDFETWVQNYFKIVDKADSAVSGAKGNTERFYVLKPTKTS